MNKIHLPLPTLGEWKTLPAALDLGKRYGFFNDIKDTLVVGTLMNYGELLVSVAIQRATFQVPVKEYTHFCEIKGETK